MLNLTDIITQTISGLIINLPWFILFFAGFKIIAKEIKESSKNIPHWITEYKEAMLEANNIIKAKNSGAGK